MSKTIFDFRPKEGDKWSWRKPIGIVLLTGGRSMPFHFMISSRFLRFDLLLKDSIDHYREEVGGLYWFTVRFDGGRLFDIKLRVPVFWLPKRTRMSYVQFNARVQKDLSRAHGYKAATKQKFSNEFLERCIRGSILHGKVTVVSKDVISAIEMREELKKKFIDLGLDCLPPDSLVVYDDGSFAFDYEGLDNWQKITVKDGVVVKQEPIFESSCTEADENDSK